MKIPLAAPLVIIFALCSLVKAEKFSDWRPSILQIVQKYEGSTEIKVTSHNDGQGLSLGILQWTIKSGSLNKIFKEVGVKKSKSLAQKHMPIYASNFVEVINSLQEKGGSSNATQISLSMQKPYKKSWGTYWKVHPTAEKEIQAWLNTKEVRAAQHKLIDKLINDSLKTTKDWKKINKDTDPITFSEYMFFFNASVQGGLGTFKGNHLSEATRLSRNYTAYNKDFKTRRKNLLSYLEQWLRTDWKIAANKSYWRDSERNADIIKKRGTELTPNEVHLLFMRFTRASVGNTPYKLTYMNRGIIDVLGEGYVNGTYYNFRALYDFRGHLK